MKNLIVTVNGVAYNVTVEEGTGAAVASAPVAAAPAAAPAPAAAGDTLLILEAMKMENEISAPQDGTIASVNVRKGDVVNSGDLLCTMN